MSDLPVLRRLLTNSKTRERLTLEECGGIVSRRLLSNRENAEKLTMRIDGLRELSMRAARAQEILDDPVQAEMLTMRRKDLLVLRGLLNNP